jgi:serine/threonine protein kinase
VIKLERVRSRRATHHLRIERESLERVTRARTPFVCTLRYAFASGSWLVLAIPFYPGGVLETQIEERAAPPHRGLPSPEVVFLAAQMCLALEGLHGLRLLHRDVKPNNMCLRRDGYYILADLGLVEPLDGEPPRGRAGSRGYWAPEVVRREPQAEAADWWSLGTTLLCE